MGVPAWLKHAFAVEDGPLDPTPRQVELVERMAAEVVRRGMTTPALAFLEMSQPLSFVASQMLVFFAPILSSFSEGRGHQDLAELLEHRGSVDYIGRAIERAASRAKEHDEIDAGGER